MKKLFLASWFAGSANLLLNFISEDLNGKKVLFIPTASSYEMMAEEREVYDFINKLDKEALEKLGFVVEVLEIMDKSVEVIEKSFFTTDGVFVCGGNIFFLMQELKRKGVDKLISRHIEQGKLYMSTSAGSVLMQKDFIDDGIDDSTFAPALKGDYSGLGFIDFYLFVHYGRNYFGDDKATFNKYYAHLDCIRIDDNQAVIVDGEKIEIVNAPKSCIPNFETE